MRVGVGDRFILTGENWNHYNQETTIGSVATIDEVDDDYAYDWTNGLGIVLRSDGSNYSEGYSVTRDVDATDPSYYEFPGGVEVRQISAHLTSFGGQALQYIARSTRLDGNNKGDTVENLRKAMKFLEWEIERLEAGDAQN